MSKQHLQDTINQMSLVMNVSEDIAKACKKAEIHPDLAKVLMRLHTAQMEMEKEINALRQTMLTMSHTLAASADLHVEHMRVVEAMARRSGFSPEELFHAEKDTENG